MDSPWFVPVVLVSLGWDFLLTFMTPALAFTTTSASQAFRIGLRMIRKTWPAAAWYVFLPPLALQFLSVASGVDGTQSLPLIYGVGLIVATLDLAAKGAVAAFYLRRVPVGRDGSLDLASQPQPPSQPPSVVAAS
ncbi:MAG: hypothetical protein QOK05_255 [Chloroflexota bacterium]|jgi:hypothetical protein|nr:hypothetical protein [Chloroflexota bacterium]